MRSLVLVIALAAVVIGAPIECKWSAADGTPYDLSALTLTTESGSNYFGSDGTYDCALCCRYVAGLFAV